MNDDKIGQNDFDPRQLHRVGETVEWRAGQKTARRGLIVDIRDVKGPNGGKRYVVDPIPASKSKALAYVNPEKVV